MTEALRQTPHKVRRRPLLSVLVAALAVTVGFLIAGSAASGAGSCATANVLSGSNFEIDTNANLKVDGGAPCIDWLSGGTNSGFASGVLAKADKGSGAGDDSFGQGTSENDANPTIVSGSIPPNKSDLKIFGVTTETGASAKFLELFWSRIQNPSGTTNMDFELNQKFCDPAKTPTNCANNGSGVTPETPIRTSGDKLITYDLSKGGTVPTISIRTWSGSAWGAATVISGGSNATAVGSVNTGTIAVGDSGGNPPAGVGASDPYTFGEAALSFSALFPTGSGCTTLGSAYLKSRSSDSFSAEVKDFIAPEKVSISNCAGLTTTATSSATVGGNISDTAHLTGVTANAGGSISFDLFSDSGCTTKVTTLGPVSVSGPNDYSSGNYQITSVGTYYWIAHYTGDLSNSAADGACGDSGESSAVGPASPGITTTPSSGGTVGVTLNDTASVTGGYSPTGTVTFSLWDPDQSGCTGTARFTQTRPLSSGSAGTTGGFVTDKTGTWRWTATYNGDSNNDTASSGCNDEQVTVNPATPGIGTVPNPSSGKIGDTLNDKATLSGGVSPTGTITFSLFAPSDSTCAGTPAYTMQVSVSGNGDYFTTDTGTATGSNTASTNGTWRWTATYSGDSKNTGTSSGCQDEQVTIRLLNSTLGTAQKWYPQDEATVTGEGGTSATGTVTFSLFKNSSTCDAAAKVYPATGTDSQNVVSGSAKTNQSTFSVGSVGVGGDTYYWKAAYSGDSTHKPVSSCTEATTFTSLANGSPAQS